MTFALGGPGYTASFTPLEEIVADKVIEVTIEGTTYKGYTMTVSQGIRANFFDGTGGLMYASGTGMVATSIAELEGEHDAVITMADLNPIYSKAFYDGTVTISSEAGTITTETDLTAGDYVVVACEYGGEPTEYTGLAQINNGVIGASLSYEYDTITIYQTAEKTYAVEWFVLDGTYDLKADIYTI